MNNFDRIRKETETIEGMAKMFCSSDWEYLQQICWSIF